MARTRRANVARVAAFVLTVVVVVAGAIAVPALDLTADRDGKTPADYPEYQPSDLVPERASVGGPAGIQRADRRGLVLIDDAHRNRYTSDEIQPLVATITAAGYRVEFLSLGDDLDAALSRADAFVVIDPGRQYTSGEVDRVESFVDSGGRLALLGEPTQATVQQAFLGVSLVTVRNQLSPLSTRFGIEFGTGYLFNMEENEGNFQNVFANPTGGTSLTRGVDQAALYTATSVEVRNGQRVLLASEGTRNSRSDLAGTHPVAVASGNVVAVGDTSFLSGVHADVVDNRRLIGNLVSFLTAAERERTLLDYPYNVRPSPTVRYTAVGLLDSAQRIGNDLGQRGQQPTVSLARTTVRSANTDVLVTTFDYLEENDVADAGITVTDGRVSVAGYESNETGILVIHSPEEGFDLVIAADTAERADQAATILVDDTIGRNAISSSTVVLRTSASTTPTPTPSAAPSPGTTSTPVEISPTPGPGPFTPTPGNQTG